MVSYRRQVCPARDQGNPMSRLRKKSREKAAQSTGTENTDLNLGRH
jgi:hypothetical protein